MTTKATKWTAGAIALGFSGLAAYTFLNNTDETPVEPAPQEQATPDQDRVRADIIHWLPHVTAIVNAVPGAVYQADMEPGTVLSAATQAAQEEDIAKLCQTLTGLRAVHAQAVVAYFHAHPEADGPVDLGQHGELMAVQDGSALLCSGRPATRPAPF
ncbi:MAG: hypothetical protein KKA05_00770 [Alphaproteobacteria bacterium]|nr:hypothetical protein [Alphaproteobacteria bacterium]